VISFRFHLVSLVAVFLALGLGVLSGTTVLNRGIVNRLEKQTDEFARVAEQLREELDEVEADLDSWELFGAEIESFLVDGRLAQAEVILVTQEGTDEEGIGAAREAIDEAGGEAVALFSVTARMGLLDEEARQDMAAILGGTTADGPEELRAQAASELADRLVFGSDAAPQLLQQLLDGGFLLDEGPPLDGGLEDLGGSDELVVVVAGGDAPPVLDPGAFLAPLVADLAQNGTSVAAVETARTAYPFVPLLRADGEVEGRALTVDSVDRVWGRVALVLGLADVMAGREPGDYGVKEGATDLLPPLP
jgi:hypothetical protein